MQFITLANPLLSSDWWEDKLEVFAASQAQIERNTKMETSKSQIKKTVTKGADNTKPCQMVGYRCFRL